MMKYFPIFNWVKQYKKEWFKQDLNAGLTVGIMLIPQGMAYAMLAGLPPIYGLYASIIPQLMYAVFGTSRQLAVGPVAMDSLLVAAGVSVFAVAGTDHYIALAILLSFMMGIIQLTLGLLRFGFLVNFLSKPIISGFTSAAALIIGFSQLKHLLGIDLERTKTIFELFYNAFQRIEELNIFALLIGFGGIVLIKFLKKKAPKLPASLIIVVISIIVVVSFHLNDQGLKIVGEIPKGLPSFSIPDLSADELTDLIPMAFTLALIAFMEAISVAKAVQLKHSKEYTIDNNQELIGLGAGNIAGSFFSAYPTTGGFSRTAVNDQSGAKTNLSAIISALLIVVTLLFLTPLFYYLPKAVLGSIVMVAVFGLIDFNFPKTLWKSKREDFWMLLITFVITLLLGIKEGILIGVLLSILLLVYRVSKPHIAFLGKVKGTHTFKNIDRFNDLELFDNVLIVRHDAELYFTNVNNFIETLQLKLKESSVSNLVLDFCSVSSIDSTALFELTNYFEDLHQNGVKVNLTNVIGPVRDYLTQSNFYDQNPYVKQYLNNEIAINKINN